MTKRIGTWFGYGWAQPVVNRRWAFIATVCQCVKRATNYRVGNHAMGYAHCRACGVPTR